MNNRIQNNIITYLQLKLAIIGNGISSMHASKSQIFILIMNALVGDLNSLFFTYT